MHGHGPIHVPHTYLLLVGPAQDEVKSAPHGPADAARSTGGAQSSAHEEALMGHHCPSRLPGETFATCLTRDNASLQYLTVHTEHLVPRTPS